MIHSGEVVGYKKTSYLKGVVLEDLLIFLRKKSGIEFTKLPSNKTKKIAVDSSLDSEANEIVSSIIQGNALNLKKSLPVEGNIIKPLYLFLDEEILLYSKIKKLKFKKNKETNDKIKEFINEFEKKHPEVKRAVVNSLLELYK
jgi:tRNA(Ile)-lysidine synthase TilS/MesJ